MTNLEPSERLEVHAARVKELIAGEISGKEFVGSLVRQCGFSEIEAKRQWQDLKDNVTLAIYFLKAGDLVQYPLAAGQGFCVGRITTLYGGGAGAVVSTSDGRYSMRVPFTLFELRVAK